MSKSGFSYPDRILVRIWDFQTKLGESWRVREGWTVCSQYKMIREWPKVQYCKLYIKCTCVQDSYMQHFGIHVALHWGWTIRKVMGPGEGFLSCGNFIPLVTFTLHARLFFSFLFLLQNFFYVLCPPPLLQIIILYKQSTVFFQLI